MTLHVYVPHIIVSHSSVLYLSSLLLPPKTVKATYQQGIILLDQDGYNPEKSHGYGEIRLIERRGLLDTGRYGGSVLDVGREQLDHQRTDSILQQKVELRVLKNK